MRTPQAFYNFTLQFPQGLDLVYPDWASDAPTARHEIYQSFRQRYGDQAVRDLNAFSERLLSDERADLEALWFKESKADWVISNEGIRLLLKDFQTWASSL
ncbi:hypothetical protein [Tabrizicola sp.]|uniref:hypothetical protein n=1 Tax=Tabrizicola sp. TaxID=2005166 RepID=UPI002628D46B|nr:hypothetical protein [Tabrizicola sp.]MDM7931572.1 hypothetical protein [Tabrizicola sp.]